MEAFNPNIPADRVLPVPYRIFTASDVTKLKDDNIAKHEKKKRRGKVVRRYMISTCKT